MLIWAFMGEGRYHYINLFEFNMSTTFLLMFWLKTYFHAGRPYMEDVTLADTSMHELAACEFGLPSGHSMSMGLMIFNHLYFT